MAEDNQNLKPFGRGFGGRGRRFLEGDNPQQPQQASASSSSSSSGTYLSPAGGAIRKNPSVGRPVSSSSGYESTMRTSPTPPASMFQAGMARGRGFAFAQLKESSDKSTSSSSTSFGRGQAFKALLEKRKAESQTDSESISGDIARLSISRPPEEEVRFFAGTAGQLLDATSNWVRIALEPEKQVFEYAITFHPEVDNKDARHRILNVVLAQGLIGNVKSFDGGTKLWLPRKLQGTTVLPSTHPFTHEPVEIKLVLKHELAIGTCVQLYNVLFNRVMKTLKMTLMGKGYFSQELATSVKEHHLELWPGFVTGAHQMEGGVMLNVDCSHRVLRDMTVYSFMQDLLRENSHASFRKVVTNKLVGEIVMTRYNKKTYRVDDIKFDANPRSLFEMRNGQQISYVDYYRNTYNIPIRDLSQPLLMHKLKKKELKDKDKEVFIFLIPELCHLTGLTDDMRQDFRTMKDISQHTRLTPNARQAKLRQFLRNVKDNPEAAKILGDWGLTLMDHTIQVQARQHMQETVTFGRNRRNVPQNADWNRECCKESVLAGVDLLPQSWLLLVTQKFSRVARGFLTKLQQVTLSMGIQVGAPNFIELRDDTIQSYLSAIQKNYISGTTTLVVAIFPSQREDRYSAVKRKCINELGISSQCINVRTISRDGKLQSVTCKIALQINCKLGGQLWRLDIPVRGIMVCGTDVYHDPVKKGASVVGFVASLNQSVTRWYTHVQAQKPGEEIVNGMKISFMECLKAYFNENHSYPETIIIFRDGVSEGMLKLTEEYEVPQITTTLMNLKAAKEIKFYYIVVLKRISTRVFVSLNAGSYDNPPSGTVVDSVITKRHWNDFFLVSQHVRQGTVSPTHYIVLKNSGGLSPDNIQRLTYKMTHLYYNWPGTIRVPAPCQYAHKVAYLIGQNVRKEPHAALRDKLYYL